MSDDMMERMAVLAMVVSVALVYFGTSEAEYPYFLREAALLVGIVVFACSAVVLL